MGRKVKKLPGADVYYGRVEHPAVDRGARRVAALALGVALMSVGFAVTILGWVTWMTA